MKGNIVDIHLTRFFEGTLRNPCASFSCEFEVYLLEQPGKYGILFRCLADVEERFVSRFILY